MPLSSASPAQQARAADLSLLTTQQLIDHILTLETAAAASQHTTLAHTHTSSSSPSTTSVNGTTTAPIAPLTARKHKRPHSDQSTAAKLEAGSSNETPAVDSTQPAVDIPASSSNPTTSPTLSPLPPPTKQQRLSSPTTTTATAPADPPAPPPTFDYWSYPIRHIALRLLYLGQPYYGFSSQSTSTLPTVESHLFHALLATRLVVSRTSCHYQRCGRTDRGVHAGGQLVSLWLRSRVKQREDGSVPVGWVSERKKQREKRREERRASGEVILVRHLEDARDSDDDTTDDTSQQQPPPQSDNDDSSDDEEEKGEEATIHTSATSTTTTPSTTEVDAVDWEKSEFDYIGMLNRHLPTTIRILSYHPVPLPFSARFSCHRRTYHYLFYRDTLDIARMRAAGRLLCGKHDWRNFCTYDVTAVTHFIRRIHRVDVLPESKGAEEEQAADNTDGSGGSEGGGGGGELDEVVRRNVMWRVEVEGKGFLYHQVRCIVSILFAIGRREEPVELVSRLLDVSQTPYKPAYRMASEKGLILQHSRYDEVSDTAGGWPTVAHSTTNLVRCYTVLWQQQRQLSMEAAVVAHMAAAIHRSLLQLTVSGSGGQQRSSGLLSQLPSQLDDRVNKRWLCGGELLREANLLRSLTERVESLTGKRRERRLRVERLREEWKRKEGEMDGEA